MLKSKFSMFFAALMLFLLVVCPAISLYTGDEDWLKATQWTISLMALACGFLAVSAFLSVKAAREGSTKAVKSLAERAGIVRSMTITELLIIDGRGLASAVLLAMCDAHLWGITLLLSVLLSQSVRRYIVSSSNKLEKYKSGAALA